MESRPYWLCVYVLCVRDKRDLHWPAMLAEGPPRPSPARSSADLRSQLRAYQPQGTLDYTRPFYLTTIFPSVTKFKLNMPPGLLPESLLLATYHDYISDIESHPLIPLP